MKKRELKRSLLQLIRGREVYGYELRQLLAAHGEKVQLSYLYKTLKEMCNEDLLQSHLQASAHGPKRRLYSLTKQGMKELGKIFGDVTELIHEFYEDYVAKLPPEIFTDKFQMMMLEVYGGRESVACVTSEPLTTLHREVLLGMHARPGAKHTYLIKPPQVKADVELPNLTILDGSFDDIPLKDKSLDGMVVVDIQDAFNIRTCCSEFQRVLKSGGVMIGCAPFMGLVGEDEPLDVGEFIKRTKCNLAGKPYLEKEAIKKALAERFDYVDVACVAFMTGFICGLQPAST